MSFVYAIFPHDLDERDTSVEQVNLATAEMMLDSLSLLLRSSEERVDNSHMEISEYYEDDEEAELQHLMAESK